MGTFSNVGRTIGNLATSAFTKTLTNAITGRDGGGGKSDFADLENLSQGVGKFGIKNLRYPLDVEAAPGLGNQGHFIMFHINEQTRSELAVGELGTKYDMSDVLNDLVDENGQRKTTTSNNSDSGIVRTGGHMIQDVQSIIDFKKEETKHAAAREKNYNSANTRTKGSTVYIKRRPTTRLNTSISMYMPQQVKATYSQDYQSASIGQGAKFAADVYGQMVSGKRQGTSVVDYLKNEFPQAVREALILQSLKLASEIPLFAGAADVRGMVIGEVVADRMEIAFRNINKRSFQYNFKMLPKSREEADMVHEIIKAFKKHSAPSFKNGNRSGKTLMVPDTFHIEYMYSGNKNPENTYLHKISECILESMDVTYGGERYKTFPGNEKGAPPVETSISLTFKELELISRERIEEGF